ncbi:MAG: transketolase C-terminal domain-containing protein [Rhodospirillaceae bacterium]|nr:transketolase C-terminal domain-containing protein [Rhodospirillaceae bacterium]
MRNAFAAEVTAMAAEDPKLVLLSGDIGNRLFDELRGGYPSQFMNCGVAEANMMGVAAGMALSGLRPIVYTITPFTTTRCLEQIRVDVAYHDAPVVIVGTGSGLSYASLGPTHHSLEDFAIFRAIPNIRVLAPYDAPSLRKVLSEAVGSGVPTYIRIGKKGEQDLVSNEDAAGIGEATVVRQGEDVCVLSVGTIGPEVIAAADTLKEVHGISAEVVLVNTVKPLDESMLTSLSQRFKAIVTVEEHSKNGGYGEHVSAYLAQQGISTSITCLGTGDKFMHSVGSQSYARAYFGIDAASIVNATQDCLKSVESAAS